VTALSPGAALRRPVGVEERLRVRVPTGGETSVSGMTRSAAAAGTEAAADDAGCATGVLLLSAEVNAAASAHVATPGTAEAS
jgi:hypothetical protein